MNKLEEYLKLYYLPLFHCLTLQITSCLPMSFSFSKNGFNIFKKKYNLIADEMTIKTLVLCLHGPYCYVYELYTANLTEVLMTIYIHFRQNDDSIYRVPISIK